jgi:hypothetical protein
LGQNRPDVTALREPPAEEVVVKAMVYREAQLGDITEGDTVVTLRRRRLRGRQAPQVAGRTPGVIEGPARRA